MGSSRPSRRTGSSPRGRGTHIVSRVKSKIPGSSPRGRGTPANGHFANRVNRFIPAWAGNTQEARYDDVNSAVHPRVGGEHASFKLEIGIAFGSSPRGRGTPGRPSLSGFPQRFIPAWAGNTIFFLDILGENAVHPRVGGEHQAPHVRLSSKTGSSPRGRGTHGDRLRNPGEHRFIPAWAGNTCPAPSGHTCSPVHPRVGGEHSVKGFLGECIRGSSPRGRGTRPTFHLRCHPLRFIPAWAGNTR